MLGFGMIGFGGFGLRFLQGGIGDSGFEVPFDSFIMLDGGLGFRSFLGGSGGDNFGALELGAWMILNLGGTIGFRSLGSGFRVPSDSCTMLGFGMIGIGGFGLRSLQGGISASGFGVPFDSFTMLDGGFGFRSFLGGSGGDDFGTLEVGPSKGLVPGMILNLDGTIGLRSLLG